MNDEIFRLVISKSMKKRQQKPNEPLHVTAARWRMLLNLKSRGWAAARERKR